MRRVSASFPHAEPTGSPCCRGWCWACWCRSPRSAPAPSAFTVLILLYPRLPMARIVGSDIAHAVPLTLVAGIGHWMLGSVDWHIFGSLLVGLLPGIFLGSYLSARVAELALRIILALTLAVVGSKLAVERIQNQLAAVVSSPNQ